MKPKKFKYKVGQLVMHQGQEYEIISRFIYMKELHHLSKRKYKENTRMYILKGVGPMQPEQNLMNSFKYIISDNN